MSALSFPFTQPLYYWYAATQVGLQLPREIAKATKALLEHESNPAAQLPGTKLMAAGLDVFERLTRVYPKPAWDIKAVQIDGHAVPVKEEIADETPFYRLVKLTRDVSAIQAAPGASASAVKALARRLTREPRGMLITPISGHHATLLRGTAAEMLKTKNEVYVTEWKTASDVPASAGEFGVTENMQHIRRALTAAGPGCHLVAVCQPCPATMSAVAFMAEDEDPCKPRSLTLIAGPIDTRINPQACDKFAEKTAMADFKRTMLHTVPPGYEGHGRTVMPGFLQQAGFVSQNFLHHVNAHVDYFWALASGAEAAIAHHRKFYDEYNALLDMHGKYYEETIQWFFKEHRLPKGELVLDGRRVDLAKIDVPLLVVEGGKDDICGPGQTEAALRLCTGLPAAMKAHHLEPDAGHYGAFNGKAFRANIAPRIAAFQAKWDHAKRPRAALHGD